MDKLLTVKEVANRLRVHEVTVRRYISKGTVPAVKVGGSVRVRESDIDEIVLPTRGGKGGADQKRNRIREAIEAIYEIRSHTKPGKPSAEELIRMVRGERRHLGSKESEKNLYSTAKRSIKKVSEAELARRKKLMEEARRLRDSQPPLGITTAELIHLARTERDWRYAN
jgi:excisionase family DNA binding protein